jgi:hypothetical protein
MVFTKAVIYDAVVTICTLTTKTNPVFVLSTVFAAILVILGVTAAGLINSASAQQKFMIKLSGSNEVPAVNTAGTGVAIFQLSPDRKSLNYQLDLTKMNGVMGAHIHSGKQGENGPVLAGLFNAAMGGPPTGAVNGQLYPIKGTITSAHLQGPLAGKHISDLVKLLKTGGAYINVHTSQNQNGEIRGQVSLERTHTHMSNPSASTTTSSSSGY